MRRTSWQKKTRLSIPKWRRRSQSAGKLGCIAVASMVLLFFCGCKDATMNSHWPTSDISIDGAASEWNGSTAFVEDPGIVMGMANDAGYFYMVLITSERQLQMQIVRGLNIWFDPANNKGKSFGIRYPIFEDMTEQERTRPASREEAIKRFDEAIGEMTYIQVLGPDGRVDRVPFEDAPGIEARLGRARGAMVYELKVPFAQNEGQSFALSARPGQTISVGFETPEPGTMRHRFKGGRGPSSRRPDGSWGGGTPFNESPPTGERGEAFERPDPINVWIHVRLASKNGQPVD